MNKFGSSFYGHFCIQRPSQRKDEEFLKCFTLLQSLLLLGIYKRNRRLPQFMGIKQRLADLQTSFSLSPVAPLIWSFFLFPQIRSSSWSHKSLVLSLMNYWPCICIHCLKEWREEGRKFLDLYGPTNILLLSSIAAGQCVLWI